MSRVLKRGRGNASKPICHKKIGPVNERKIMLLMWFYIGSLIAMKAILWSMYIKYMEFLHQEKLTIWKKMRTLLSQLQILKAKGTLLKI